MEKKKENNGSFLQYLNIAGAACLTGLTAVQTVLAILWLSKNMFAGENGKSVVFHYKETGSFVLMGAVFFFLLQNIVKKVIGAEVKFWHYATVALYVMTLPVVLSINFNATLYAVCISFLLLHVLFSLSYFYGNHERRLYELIGIFAILLVLSYLNRAAFWTGVIETFLFLTIQLVRNIKIRRKNIGDKSWRNTLLLFCILIIIMLLPQYCTYNNIKHTLYSQSLEEQLSARIIVPYLEYEKKDGAEEYLLGVIRNADYGYGHPYRNFKNIIHRYEEDGLDMDTIWKNLYSNAYYRYRKSIVKRYLRDFARGLASPFLTESEMHSEMLVTHHGYYYGLFEENAEYISNIYMKFSLFALLCVSAAVLLQTIALLIIDAVKGKFKLKIEEGRHKRIEAVLLIACLGITMTAIQTLFSLEGTSYVSGMASILTCFLIATLTWFRRYRNKTKSGK
ncbi:MAG: hypothetical protein K5776_12785 [Lachnospiraceae bacterium]|nr:hypothetical protein [Lachnospiraceae bacterium]